MTRLQKIRFVAPTEPDTRGDGKSPISKDFDKNKEPEVKATRKKAVTKNDPKQEKTGDKESVGADQGELL